MFNRQIKYTQNDIDRHQNRILYLERSIKEREEFLNSVQSNASVVIDWGAFNCISVERARYKEDGYPETILTILTSLRDGATHEFTFYISNEKHEEIAEQFRQHLANRK